MSGAITGALCAAGGWWILGGAAVSGVHTAATAEGKLHSKVTKGVLNALTVAFWGGFGSTMTGQIEELAWRNLGEFIFDTEFGIVAALFDYEIQSAYDTYVKRSSSSSGFSSFGGTAQRAVVCL